MNLRLVFTVLAAVMFGLSPVFAQVFPLHFSPQHIRATDPQMLAMGLTGVAHRDGILATSATPAGIANLEELQIAYTRHPSSRQLFSDQDDYLFGQHMIALALPVFKNVVIGAQFWDFDMGKVYIYSIDNPEEPDSFNIGIRQFQVTPAFRFFDGENLSFLVGANIKYLDEYGYTDSNGWVFDFGLRANAIVNNNLVSFGASFHNMGSDLNISYDNPNPDFQQPDKLEPYRWMKIGAAIGNTRIKSTAKKTIKYLATVEFQKNLEYKFEDVPISNTDWESLNGGLELRFLDHLFGQIGYVKDISGNLGFDKIQGMTYGFGFETPEHINIGLPLSIAMAYGRSIHYGILDMDALSIILGCKL